MKPNSPPLSDPSTLQITYHGIPSSPALTERITKEVDKLPQYFDRITFCRVLVDRPNRHHRKAGLYDIHIEIGVPRELLVVRHEPSERRILTEAGSRFSKRLEVRPDRNDPYVAVRDAFVAARRRLEDYARQLRSHSEKREPLGQ